jgi:hypothetical protein
MNWPTREFDVGDLVRTPEGEVGYIDGVAVHCEYVKEIGATAYVRRWTQREPYSYSIEPFSRCGKCAWWERGELTLVERGPVFAARSKYETTGDRND